MRIGIRADGGRTIGMGHIMRTLALAKELCKSSVVFYICKTEKGMLGKYESGIQRITEEGFDTILVDENNIIEGLKDIHADVLITDSYDVDEEYFNRTKAMFRKTGYIDDNNLLPYYNVDFLINQNLGAEELKYNVNEDTELLLGTRYVMLREEFRELPINRTVKPTIKDILITIGGADPNNITENILDMIKDLDFNFHVVVGPSFTNLHTLNKIEKENDNINLYFNANMAKLMCNSDLAISSCGSTLYELAACRVPTIGIIAAENQEKLSDNMQRKGIIHNLGWYSRLEKERVRATIELMAMSDKNRCEIMKKQKCIDKNGVFNICSALKEKYLKNHKES